MNDDSKSTFRDFIPAGEDSGAFGADGYQDFVPTSEPIFRTELVEEPVVPTEETPVEQEPVAEAPIIEPEQPVEVVPESTEEGFVDNEQITVPEGVANVQ